MSVTNNYQCTEENAGDVGVISVNRALQNKPITCQQEANQMSTNIWFWHALSPRRFSPHRSPQFSRDNQKKISENSRGFINSPVLYSNILKLYMWPQSRQSANCYAFSQVVGIGTPPTPLPQPSVPPGFWGERHTRWRARGWESPNSDEGTYTVVLFIYMYFVHVAKLYGCFVDHQ